MASESAPTLAAPQGRSTLSSIYAKNLPTQLTSAELLEAFKDFGKVVSARVATDAKDQSRGYGFIQYEDPASAQVALERGAGLVLGGSQIAVGPMIPTRELTNDPDKFCNIYVKGLGPEITESTLMDTFGQMGPITSSVIMRDPSGASRGFGFVNFSTAEDAARAVEELHDVEHPLGTWQVSKALRRAERAAEMRAKYEKDLADQERLAAANLYVKNLDSSLTDDSLREMFQEYGEVLSSKVLRNFDGSSRGVGFVQMLEPPNAHAATVALNGKAMLGKILYVTTAQRRQDRAPRQSPSQHYGGPHFRPPGPMGEYEYGMGHGYGGHAAPEGMYWSPAPQMPPALAYYTPQNTAPPLYYGQPGAGAYQQGQAPRMLPAYGNMAGGYSPQQHAQADAHAHHQALMQQQPLGGPQGASRLPSLSNMSNPIGDQAGLGMGGYHQQGGRSQPRPAQHLVMGGGPREGQVYGHQGGAAPAAGGYYLPYGMPGAELGGHPYDMGPQPGSAASSQGYYSYSYSESPTAYIPTGPHGHPGGGAEVTRGRSPFRRGIPPDRLVRHSVTGGRAGFAANPGGMGRGRGLGPPRGSGLPSLAQGGEGAHPTGGSHGVGGGDLAAGVGIQPQHHHLTPNQLSEQMGALNLSGPREGK